MKIFNTGVPPLYANGMGVYISNFTAPSQKNDQNSNQPINNCTVINYCIIHNSFAQKPCLHWNTANIIIHNSSVINSGGAAW